MGQLLDALAADLPRLDLKVVAQVVKDARTYPTAALRLLLRRLASDDPAVQAVAERVLASCGGPAVIENLKATVFDVTAPEKLKLRANELLAEVDTPVDPDVLEMGVPQAAKRAADLPGRVCDALAAGRFDEAAERFRRQARPAQAMLIHRLAAVKAAGLTRFLRFVSEGDEYVQEAALCAVSAHALADAADLVVEWASSLSKTIQKAAKRAIFDLKAAGVVVPEPPAEAPQAESQAEPADDQLPVYRATAVETPEGALDFVSVARLRPNGRLKLLLMSVDPWRGGIRMAAYRSDVSQSAYDRTLRSIAEKNSTVRDADLGEVRRLAALGLAAARALGTRIPLDFQLGRSLLGPMDEEIASAGAPFRCASCGGALGEETLRQVRDSLVYDHVKIERRCPACLKAEPQERQKAAGDARP
jgi:hypothetical protein